MARIKENFIDLDVSYINKTYSMHQYLIKNVGSFDVWEVSDYYYTFDDSLCLTSYTAKSSSCTYWITDKKAATTEEIFSFKLVDSHEAPAPNSTYPKATYKYQSFDISFHNYLVSLKQQKDNITFE